jgi:hypothetical protein
MDTTFSIILFAITVLLLLAEIVPKRLKNQRIKTQLEEAKSALEDLLKEKLEKADDGIDLERIKDLFDFIQRKLEKGTVPDEISLIIMKSELDSLRKNLKKEETGYIKSVNEESDSNQPKTERVVRWFEKCGDRLLGEIRLEQENVGELQMLFDIPSDNPMYECYLIETEAQVKYFQDILRLKLDTQSYDYFLECDAM